MQLAIETNVVPAQATSSNILSTTSSGNICPPSPVRKRPSTACSMVPSPIITTARKGISGLPAKRGTSVSKRRPRTQYVQRRRKSNSRRDIKLKSIDYSSGNKVKHSEDEAEKDAAKTKTVGEAAGDPAPTRERIPIRFHRVSRGEAPTVLFPYPPGLKIPARADPPQMMFCPKKRPRMKYLLYWERNCIKTVFHAAGLIRSKDKDPARHASNTMQCSGDWNVAWTKHFPIEQYRTLRPEQRVNSFPGTGCIGRKDTLASIMERFDRRFSNGGPFRFVPQTFILRGHYGEMDRFLRAARKRAGHREPRLALTTTERRRRRQGIRNHGRRRASQKKRRNKKGDRNNSLRSRGLTARKSSESSSSNSDSDTDDSSHDDSDDSDEFETAERKDARILGEERRDIEKLKRMASMDQDRMGSRSGFSSSSYMDNGDETDDKDARDGHDLWICKPSSGSCGRGIRLCHYKEVKNLPMTHNSKNVLGERVLRQRVWNVQEYIADPLCIEGRKFDLRVYVLVTSFDPLRVYVFREGLCRICTQEYDLDYDHLDDTFRHLTNFSINKHAEDFVANEDADKDDHGHKWSLSALFDHLDAHGYDVKRLWRDMKEVAVKTLIACESEVYAKHQTLNGADKCCYEVFGFDMLLNESLFVYLIEVNIYPSMATGSPLDKRIKQTMIADALQIKGIPLPGSSSSRSSITRNSTRITSKQKREVLRRRLRTGKLGKFSDEDLAIVRESAAEFSRAATTNYDIAFPSASSIKRLAGYFISPRYNNTLLHMLLQQEDEDECDDEANVPAYDPYPTSKRQPRVRRRSSKSKRKGH